MRIALFGIQYFNNYIDNYQSIVNKLELANCELSVNHDFYNQIKQHIIFKVKPLIYKSLEDFDNNPDVLFSLGGDGTILDSVQIVRDSNIPILGINMGRLGFLSSVSINNVNEAIEGVIKNNYILDKRTLLSLETDIDLFNNSNFAMNEFSIQKKDHLSMIVVHVYVDDQFLNSYWSDGILIATPTGSTAYSLSVGGPIVTSGAGVFVISPIAPHNLTVRPIVIPDNSTIKLKIQGRSQTFLVGLDSRFETIEASTELVVKKSNFSVSMIQIGSHSFFETIREKLNWGLDVRN